MELLVIKLLLMSANAMKIVAYKGGQGVVSALDAADDGVLNSGADEVAKVHCEGDVEREASVSGGMVVGIDVNGATDLYLVGEVVGGEEVGEVGQRGRVAGIGGQAGLSDSELAIAHEGPQHGRHVHFGHNASDFLVQTGVVEALAEHLRTAVAHVFRM